MPTPSESQAALRVVTAAAVQTANSLVLSVDAAPEARRAALLDAVPAVIGYYGEGSAALAADFYDDQRDLAGAARRFTAEPMMLDRTVKIRRAVAWASEPMFAPMTVTTEQRLSEIVLLEVARPYRDTILDNRRNDPESVGWRRITGVCCRFCRMLADRGAVYRSETATFAAHPSCDCTAQPVFQGNNPGTEVGAIQYMASRRNRTPQTRQRIRDYLDANYPN